MDRARSRWDMLCCIIIAAAGVWAVMTQMQRVQDDPLPADSATLILPHALDDVRQR
jgi:hypothetical protein